MTSPRPHPSLRILLRHIFFRWKAAAHRKTQLTWLILAVVPASIGFFGGWLVVHAWTTCPCSKKSLGEILWSQEAAGWGQAVFTVAAIYFTYRLASAEGRREVSARRAVETAKARRFAIAHLDVIRDWKDVTQRLIHDFDDRALARKIIRGDLANILPPTELMNGLGQLAEIGLPGRLMEAAIHLAREIQVKSPSLVLLAQEKAKHPQMAFDQRFDRLWRLAELTRRAERALTSLFDGEIDGP